MKKRSIKLLRYSGLQLVRLSVEPSNSSLHTKSHPGKVWAEQRQTNINNNKERIIELCIMMHPER